MRRGWRVWLTESLGPQKLAIPDVKGRDQRFATIEIRRAGFQTGTVAEMPWPGAQPGAVIAQSPEPNASGVESPVMNLLVASENSGSQQAGGLVMPNLEGQVFTSAALVLTRMGLRLAPVKEEDMHIGTPVVAGVVPGEPAPDVSAGNGDRAESVGWLAGRCETPIELTVAK